MLFGVKIEYYSIFKFTIQDFSFPKFGSNVIGIAVIVEQ